MDDGTLIDLVRQFPIIYDKSNKNFKDKNMRENAWDTIASTLNIDVKTAQNRWNVLRTKYNVERKKDKNTPSGSAPTKPWLLFPAMCFLEKHIAMRKTVGNIISSQTKSYPTTPTRSTSPWSSLNIILENNDSEEIVGDSGESNSQDLEFNDSMESRFGQCSQMSEGTDKENIEIANQEQEIIVSKNETPPLKRKRRKLEESNVMTKMSSAFDNFNDYLKKKINPDQPTANLQFDSTMNLMKAVGNDLMQIKSKKIRSTTELEIVRIVKKALLDDDMADD